MERSVPHHSPDADHPGQEKPALRTAIVVLILVNIVLGIALLATSPSRAASATQAAIIEGPHSCCRGEGPEAYCCHMCCWRGPYCTRDSDCGDAE